MKWTSVINDRVKGGLAIPDLNSRLQALQVMWLQKYLSAADQRPDWAYLMDEILFKNVQKKPIVDDAARLSWITQSWHESEAADTTIPHMMRIMLKTARSLNIGLDGRKYGYETRMQMPLWHHFAVRNNYYWNKKTSRCLRNNHGITTVENAIDYNERNVRGCEHLDRCQAILQTILTLIPQK